MQTKAHFLLLRLALIPVIVQLLMRLAGKNKYYRMAAESVGIAFTLFESRGVFGFMNL